MDITETLAPKSNQLNTDDLIAAPRTILITKVTAGNNEQPVAVHFDGDQGKPWYPCKSMRRVLVAAWGADASQYVGRGVTLFRDPSVTYGGIQVGGIRISHLSGLDGPLSIALTVTRQKRAPYKVLPLQAASPAAPAPTKPVPAGGRLVPVAGGNAPAGPTAEQLVADADAACRRSGLTDAGIAAFILEFSNGTTSDLADAPPEVLTKIARQGVSKPTVERCNAAPADGPDDLPAAWP